MAPATITNVAELTKDQIANLYFRSLADIETRKTHLILTNPPNPVPTPQRAPNEPHKHGPEKVPQVNDFQLDFVAWYGGVLSPGAGEKRDRGLESEHNYSAGPPTISCARPAFLYW